MNAVWKYPVGTAAKFQVPEGGTIVHVGMDPGGIPCVWIEVDVSHTKDIEERSFAIFGTGHPLTPGWLHRGSFVDGSFVWHVYEGQAGGDGD